MISAHEALQQLRDGNRRFVSEIRNGEARANETRRRELAARQDPFAIVLGCSDSRVPAEIIFDQGLGDLFVIRVAGNIVAPQREWPSTTTSRVPKRAAANSTLSTCDGATTLPATRMTNRSPSP